MILQYSFYRSLPQFTKNMISCLVLMTKIGIFCLLSVVSNYYTLLYFMRKLHAVIILHTS